MTKKELQDLFEISQRQNIALIAENIRLRNASDAQFIELHCSNGNPILVDVDSISSIGTNTNDDEKDLCCTIYYDEGNYDAVIEDYWTVYYMIKMARGVITVAEAQILVKGELSTAEQLVKTL